MDASPSINNDTDNGNAPNKSSIAEETANTSADSAGKSSSTMLGETATNDETRLTENCIDNDKNKNSNNEDGTDAATLNGGVEKNIAEIIANKTESGEGIQADNSEPEVAATSESNNIIITADMDKMDVDDEAGDADAPMAENKPEEGNGADGEETKDDEMKDNNLESESNTTKQNNLQSTEEGKSNDSESNVTSEDKAEPVASDVGTGNGADEKAPPVALPVMKGTLCFEEDTRRHLIRGMWNYENSTAFPPQRFELLRSLLPEEDLKRLPQDGEFHGSFSLMYTHMTSKGKKKERSKVIPESGVNVTFTKQEDDTFIVKGRGTNQFGIFLIEGTAIPNSSSDPNDPTFRIELRKRYEEAAPAPAGSSDSKHIATLTGTGENQEGPLPSPTESFPVGVICLRGKLVKEDTGDTLGINESVHKINGMWAAGLNFLEDGGPTNRFEYEHKSSGSPSSFPVSGRYSGWFDLTNEDGSKTRINERDVTLKFRKNNADGYNIDGRGMNVFGKYNITGTLTADPDNMITIFRHFQPRKIKAKTSSVSSAVPSDAPAVAQRRPSLVQAVEPILKLDDVEAPPEAETGSQLEPITPPATGIYSAVSRGVLRVNDDGAHSCQGKWAVTREHFTNGLTSPFTFRLESHFAQEASSGEHGERQFPLDSDRYKGSFQLKKQGSRYQTIVDQQVVMKFRLNSQGSYNVYGVGVNPIGKFNLLGTLVMSGKTGGQVELYRIYPPEQLTIPPVPQKSTNPVSAVPKPDGALARQASSASLGAGRRESTRLVKLPSKLEDDDLDALLSRTMSKCAQILRAVREKDVEMGAFFSEPVDPVALGIPSYHQIIKEPMDLRTIHRKMETSNVTDPEEFARLVRLVFQNAMTFNVDPTHSVHQAGRSLLVMFNQKFREVERIMAKIADEEKGGKKSKEERKRKREGEAPKSLKKLRLEEAQALAAANSAFFADIVSSVHASATTVSRVEFNLLLSHMQLLSKQIVDTHTILAEMSPGDENDAVAPMLAVSGTSVMRSSGSVASSSAPERKKAPKRKIENVAVAESAPVDDSMPLTLEEQELLTETINDLPPEHLGGVIQIIREAAPVGADEDEIDLEIDQLDTKTQRKLLRHVMKVSIFRTLCCNLFCCFEKLNIYIGSFVPVCQEDQDEEEAKDYASQERNSIIGIYSCSNQGYCHFKVQAWCWFLLRVW